MRQKPNAYLRRHDPRDEIVDNEIRGILTRVSDDGTQGPFIIWDISDRGMRLWSAVPLSTGENIRLTIAKPFVLIVNAEVRWCKESDDGNGYHIGVKALSNFGRLEALHKSAVTGIHVRAG